ncbi:inositol-polyphosphate 5-phosphatase [Schizosaccharomyces japonicus yFS275]|uniref:phosphoinositide 5-phosphatase n=1 Tax=Schizosaccharomyces japonicus (strain yFS275 / FY16936) TaxID=402676 RepID=B6JUS9_SCHJY|nr:inositol-polyphosphate 5-phosphatase [Schizosaccharomyces japonicus yFS275]EEB05068.1 inositol-polyphosphate 5-phosphatase [Schizosaccharomyces japonicus yFS275]
MQCWLREQPRALALTNQCNVLLFHSVPKKQNLTAAVALAEYLPQKEHTLDGFRKLTSRPLYGTLGLIDFDGAIFLCVISGVSEVARVREGESVRKIMDVGFYCLNKSDWDHVRQESYTLDTPENYENESMYESAHSASTPYSSLRKLLTDGTFYFSQSFDLTSKMQLRASQSTTDPVYDSMHEQFMWNKFMLEQLLRFRAHLNSEERTSFDKSCFLTCIIRGYASTANINLGFQVVNLTLISRLSSLRAGTRFLARGIDDDGNVANFVETETIITSKNWCASFVQLRGSIPIFWEQEGMQMFGQKIDITRPVEATTVAFEKHVSDIIEEYGPLHIVNLLGTPSGERSLTERLRLHVELSREKPLIHLTEFDYHSQVKSFEHANKIRPLVFEDAAAFGFYFEDANHNTLKTQDGVFRTNCLDCLDRTNVIQNILSRIILENILVMARQNAGSEMWQIHSTIWANNGDALSRIYTGTGALKSSFTRKGKLSLAGALNDLSKSVGRMYINNFQDKGRQETIDTLLGKIVNQHPVILYDPIHEYVNSALQKHANEFSSQKEIHVFVGSYNLNGCTATSKLEPWLFPNNEPMADIYVIGFQEIVELTPQQVISADPAKRVEWEKCVQDVLDSHAEEGEKYVLVRSGQLVGTALLFFAKEKHLNSIRNLEGTVKKTGLGGVSGNKGAVAIRFDFDDTAICFVTSHLAAGYTNYDERNHDYHTISHGLRFKRGRSIFNHDYVLWFGDFNYRISLTYEEVVQCIQQGKLEYLFDSDQLNTQMLMGAVFPFFSEQTITFPPTYKFDIQSDTYDTSDKHRVPAWTDRILFRGEVIPETYGCCPLYASDHRPIYGTFRMKITKTDKAKKKKMFNDFYTSRKQAIHENDRTSLNLIDLGMPVSAERRSYHNTQSLDKLKKPSNEKGKWWLDDGFSAKSHVKAPKSGYVLNPSRADNPFEQSTIPEWIDPKNPETQKPVAPNPSFALPRKPLKPSKPDYLSAAPIKPILPLRPQRSDSPFLQQANSTPNNPSRATSVLSTGSSDLLETSPEQDNIPWKPLF